MADFFLELFGEEIPARMQADAAAELGRRAAEALRSLRPTAPRLFHGPRRIALALALDPDEGAGKAAAERLRGPREGAPEAALAGFLARHGAAREELVAEGGYLWLRRDRPARGAAEVIGTDLAASLRAFPWPKSMRWGASEGFSWVRPLRRIVALLDGSVVPLELGPVRAGAESEGHRFHAPGAFAVTSAAQWEGELRARKVVADADERRRMIADGLERRAAGRGLRVRADEGLLAEVAGLVEWPVPLLGAIDAVFMELPPEVRELSMKVNQRYFALRDADGRAAPGFGFVANIAAADGGGAIVAGNERVLRARLADARHFWDLDRRTPLADRLPALERVVLHGKLGNQGARALRIAALAGRIAREVGADPGLAERAGLLCKADLVSGMVGEFPELQGVMGRYYALHDGEGEAVADAIRDHYAPRGAADAVPEAPVSVAVALADRIDMLAGFFAAGERPTGGGDPFALRRAGLGIVRILRAHRLGFDLVSVLDAALAGHGTTLAGQVSTAEIMEFLAERLRVQLRAEGGRHDILAAVFAAARWRDLLTPFDLAAALAEHLGTERGADLLIAYRRAANILRIENAKDGPHEGAPDTAAFAQPEEAALLAAITASRPDDNEVLDGEAYIPAKIARLAALRAPVDAFFAGVTVNAPSPALRANRLRLLARLVHAMDRIADFSKIEG